MSLLAVITKDDDAIFTITLFIDTYCKRYVCPFGDSMSNNQVVTISIMFSPYYWLASLSF